MVASDCDNGQAMRFVSLGDPSSLEQLQNLDKGRSGESLQVVGVAHNSPRTPRAQKHTFNSSESIIPLQIDPHFCPRERSEKQSVHSMKMTQKLSAGAFASTSSSRQEGSISFQSAIMSKEFMELVKRFEVVAEKLDDNLAYTKAIFRRTAKKGTQEFYDDEELGDYKRAKSREFIHIRSSNPHTSQLVEFREYMKQNSESPSHGVATIHQFLRASQSPGSSYQTGSIQGSYSTPEGSTILQPELQSLEKVRDNTFNVKDGSRSRTMLELTRHIMESRKNRTSRFAAAAWRFLEDKNSSMGGFIYFYIRDVFLFFAVVLACVDITTGRSGSEIELQLAIEALFALELMFRFCLSPQWKTFWFRFYNIIDLVAAFPIVLRVIILCNTELKSSLFMISLLSVVPVLRLLKVMRYFETFQLLLHALEESVKVLPVLLITLFLMSITFAALVYFCEPRDNVPTIPFSLYFVLVTLSTVGYGDVSPVTNGGRISAVMCIIVGSIYMAIPLGIVGKTFGDVWEDRHRLILLQRMRNCVESAGYNRQDLKVLFSIFDKNGDGMLDVDEFAALLDIMQVNVDQKLVRKVFKTFDESDEMCVDFTALVHGLFPRHHWY